MYLYDSIKCQCLYPELLSYIVAIKIDGVFSVTKLNLVGTVVFYCCDQGRWGIPCYKPIPIKLQLMNCSGLDSKGLQCREQDGNCYVTDRVATVMTCVSDMKGIQWNR